MDIYCGVSGPSTHKLFPGKQSLLPGLRLPAPSGGGMWACRKGSWVLTLGVSGRWSGVRGVLVGGFCEVPFIRGSNGVAGTSAGPIALCSLGGRGGLLWAWRQGWRALGSKPQTPPLSKHFPLHQQSPCLLEAPQFAPPPCKTFGFQPD